MRSLVNSARTFSTGWPIVSPWHPCLVVIDRCEKIEQLRSTVTVRRLVKEGRQEKEASFPQFAVGLCDQGSQVGPALLEEVATPSDQATDTYGIGGNFIASHAAIALFHPPPNGPFASIIGPI